MMALETIREQLSATGRGYVTLEVPPRPAADLAAPEALARAADEVPAIEPTRRPTGRGVAAMYAEILEARVVEPGPEEPAAVATARRLLYTDAGESVPTRAHKAYLDLKHAFDAERAAGRTGDTEWRALQSAQPGRIEAAMATLSQHPQSALRAAFSAARAAFDAGRREGTVGRYHVCNATPSAFWAAKPGPHDTSIAQVGRPLMRVLLERPWLRLALLGRDGWSVPGREAGAYSNGRADKSNVGLLALVPITLFIGWDEHETPLIVAWDNLVVPRCPQRSST